MRSGVAWLIVGVALFLMPLFSRAQQTTTTLPITNDSISINWCAFDPLADSGSDAFDSYCKKPVVSLPEYWSFSEFLAFLLFAVLAFLVMVQVNRYSSKGRDTGTPRK